MEPLICSAEHKGPRARRGKRQSAAHPTQNPRSASVVTSATSSAVTKSARSPTARGLAAWTGFMRGQDHRDPGLEDRLRRKTLKWNRLSAAPSTKGRERGEESANRQPIQRRTRDRRAS